MRFFNLWIMAMAISDSENATARRKVSSHQGERRQTTKAIIAPINHNIQNRLSVIRFIYEIELW